MTPDQKAAVERLNAIVKDSKLFGFKLADVHVDDIQTALAYIDDLKRAKEELVRTGIQVNDIAGDAYWGGRDLNFTGDAWVNFRAALQRHKEP